MKEKPFVKVCFGRVQEPCNKVLDNQGIESIKTKEDAEALAIAGIIKCSHGLCMSCLEKLEKEIDQLIKK